MNFLKFVKVLIVGPEKSIGELLTELAQEIERAGQIELEAQRILHGCCSKCGVKLLKNHPSYHCLPDCASHLTDPYKEQE